MKRFRILALALFSVFALGAIAATAASAELPEALPSEEFKFKSKGGEARLVTKAGTILCTEGTSEGSIKAKKGKAAIKFKGCKQGVNGCVSLGDKGELILFEAEVHLVTVLLAGVLLLGLLVLLPSSLLHLECGIALVLILGSVIGEFPKLKSLEKVSSAELSFAEAGGVQAIKTCDEPALCKGAEFQLKAALVKAEEPGVEITTQTVTPEKEMEFHF